MCYGREKEGELLVLSCSNKRTEHVKERGGEKEASYLSSSPHRPQRKKKKKEREPLLLFFRSHSKGMYRQGRGGGEGKGEKRTGFGIVCTRRKEGKGGRSICV